MRMQSLQWLNVIGVFHYRASGSKCNQSLYKHGYAYLDVDFVVLLIFGILVECSHWN